MLLLICSVFLLKLVDCEIFYLHVYILSLIIKKNLQIYQKQQSVLWKIINSRLGCILFLIVALFKHAECFIAVAGEYKILPVCKIIHLIYKGLGLQI